ncbi:MAG: DUF1653 domain-containing protein [Candidatus Nomurabacteria bacterium]|nr:DUF1653 domain-containing protein [Candidatus Nomurabacteria bacterium]
MKPQIGEFYYHFKHDQGDVYDHSYVVEGFGLDAEKDCEVLFYKPLYEVDILKGSHMKVFVRSLDNFTEIVMRERKTFERFSKVTDPEIISKLELKKKELFG